MPRRATRRGSSRAAVWQPERSPEKHNLDHFERFCWTLKLPDDGGRFRLEEFQLVVLEDYFNGFFENLWELPTGTGKSTLLGALALHHVVYVRRRPRVFILGGLGTHGRNTLDAAGAFIAESPDLSRWLKPQEYGMGRIKSIIPGDTRESGIVVSSAGRRVGGRGGASQEGSGPTAIFVEETHRHEDGGSAAGVLISKTQKRGYRGLQVQVVHATTAGDSKKSYLGQLEARALDVKEGARVQTNLRRGEHYTRAVDADGDLVMHKWAVPDRIQPPEKGSPKAKFARYFVEVKKANPAPMVTVQSIRRTFRAMSEAPWMFQRQNANQWVVTGHTAIRRPVWDACKVDGLKIPNDPELRLVVGLDVADKWATTAITPVWVNEDGKVCHAGATILTPKAPGVIQRKTQIVSVLETMLETWPNMVVAFDRARGGGLIAEQLEDEHGLTVVEHSQGRPFALSSMRFVALVDQGDFMHDGNEEVADQVCAAVVRTMFSGKLWRIDDPPDGRPIDAADGLVMAAHVALSTPEEDEYDRPSVDMGWIK